MSVPDAHTSYLLEEGYDVETALRFHFESRLFPPVSLDWIPAVKRTIAKAQKCTNKGEPITGRVEGPWGGRWSVADLIEGMNLTCFLKDPHVFGYDAADDDDEGDVGVDWRRDG